MSNNDPVINQSAEREHHGFFTKVGALLFGVQKSSDKQGSKVVKDESFIGLQDHWGSMVKLVMGNAIVKAVFNLGLYASNNLTVSVKGDKQEVISGTKTQHVKEDHKKVVGSQGANEKAAAQGLQNATNAVQQARLSAMDTKGQMVQCPVCNVTHLVDNHVGLIDGIFDFIRNNIPPMFCFPFDTIQHLIDVLVAPFLSPKKNIALTGPAGCGSPACQGGMIESPVAGIKAADAATAAALDAQKAEIEKHSKAIGSGGAAVVPYKSDVIYRVGLKKNNAPAYKKKGHHVFGFRWVPGTTRPDYLAMDSKGSAEKVVFCPPQRTHGSMLIDVSNNFSINAGTPGIDILTQGRLNISAGDMIINATEGEAILGSGNVTTIKGKNIILDANDNSGDTGIAIQSAHTMVHGSFNVRGNAAFKGHLTTDGSISTPHLICPSMRTQSSVGASSKYVSEGANWEGSAQALSYANRVTDLAFKYDPFTNPGFMTTIAGLFSLVVEYYDSLMLAITLEPLPTGIFFGVGAGFGAVAVSGFIWNFKHNHMKVGSDHEHEVTTPLASYWNNRKAWGQERAAGQTVPLPSPGYGDSPAPGPKSKPGGCGGGGLYTQMRNENYGLNPLDAYNGGNYIPLSITRDENGNLTNIPPQYSFNKYPATGGNPLTPNTGTNVSGNATEPCP